MQPKLTLTKTLAFVAIAVGALVAFGLPNQDGFAAESSGGSPVVVLETSKGVIEVELDTEKAPISVENFLAYVDAGFYDGTVFHRVIKGFMVQGGGMEASGKQKDTRAPIHNEADNGLKNDRGTLAMARTAEIHSATAQFFINHADNDFLNHGGRDFGYAVFGKVTTGMDVVDAIADVATRPGDVPTETIEIKSAKRKSAD